MVCCPTTGCTISLGVEVDPVTFERTPDFVAAFHCAACGAEHPWSKADAWIAAAEFMPSTPTEAGASRSRSPRAATSGRCVPAECGMPLAA